MASGPPIVLSVDQAQLKHVALELRSMADGKALGKAFRTELRLAAEPTVRDAKAAILSAPARRSAAPPLRAAIAARVGIQVRTVGRNPSVAIRARKTPMVRGFRSAAKNFNKPSFRHLSFGKEPWRTQVGAPGWFDKTMAAHRSEFRSAATRAVDHWAAEAARRMK